MIRPHNLQIAIILVAMAGFPAAGQAQEQVIPDAARAAGVAADSGTTKAADKQEAKSGSLGASKWTAGATSFASPDKAAWGGSRGFSSTNKASFTPGGSAFSESGAQPGGVWRSRPGSSTPEDATSTKGTEAESSSAEPATPEMQALAPVSNHVSARQISRSATSRMPVSGMGTHQSAIGIHQSVMSGHQFALPLQARAGVKPTFGISGQRHSSRGTSFAGRSGMRGSLSGSSVGRHETTGTGPGDRLEGLSPAVGKPQSGIGLGGTTGSGFDQNPWEPRLHSGESKPQ